MQSLFVKWLGCSYLVGEEFVFGYHIKKSILASYKKYILLSILDQTHMFKSFYFILQITSRYNGYWSRSNTCQNALTYFACTASGQGA